MVVIPPHVTCDMPSMPRHCRRRRLRPSFVVAVEILWTMCAVETGKTHDVPMKNPLDDAAVDSCRWQGILYRFVEDSRRISAFLQRH
jgi:hypothetical protein